MVEAKLKPDTKSGAYNAMANGWPLIRDLMGETQAMQEAGETWLPRWPKESPTRYDIRLAATTLYNGFQRTINVLVGKVFASDIVMSEDMPQTILDIVGNIDAAGTKFEVFAKEWFSDGLQLGISHVLVDTPRAEGEIRTRAQAAAAGLRPYWVHVPPENLIFWKSDIIDGQRKLSKIRIKETLIEYTEWGENTVDEIRQFELKFDGQRYVELLVFRKNEKGDWFIYDEGRMEIDEIPLATFYARKTGYMTGKPPLADLAWTNVTHWRSSSEQRHCLGIGRRPFPAFLGFQKDEMASVEIGPHSGVVATNPNSKVMIVEPTGAALSSGRQDLQDLKEEMATLGLELLVRKPVEKTATESTNEKEETDSDLSGMAQEFESAVNRALYFTAKWSGEADGGSISVNKDYGVSMLNRDELNALIQSRQSRDISWHTFMDALMRRGILPEDLDLENERAVIKAEGD